MPPPFADVKLNVVFANPIPPALIIALLGTFFSNNKMPRNTTLPRYKWEFSMRLEISWSTSQLSNHKIELTAWYVMLRVCIVAFAGAAKICFSAADLPVVSPQCLMRWPPVQMHPTLNNIQIKMNFIIPNFAKCASSMMNAWKPTECCDTVSSTKLFTHALRCHSAQPHIQYVHTVEPYIFSDYTIICRINTSDLDMFRIICSINAESYGKCSVSLMVRNASEENRRTVINLKKKTKTKIGNNPMRDMIVILIDFRAENRASIGVLFVSRLKVKQCRKAVMKCLTCNH